jgi:hypothetical protein
MNGMIGANPATPLEGTLYRNVNGTWTAYYTPYIYPHPLRGAVTAVYATSETQSIESQTTETYEPQSTQSSESESTEPNELLTADTDETQQAETAEPSPSATPPNAPSNLVASAINFSKILLSWSDNSNNEEGFKIEQCTDSACGKASLFATTPANTNQCSANRSVNVEYYYRVRAYNSSGDSGYTNIVGIDGKKVSRR